MKYNSMETAPKDGNYILVWNEDNYLTEGVVGEWLVVAWIDDWVNYPGSKPEKRWCVYGSWQDEQGGNITADNPLCWTPLPENPE